MSTPEGERDFGKYRLLERIATGGMAEIYRARYDAAAGVSKPVVIKKILPAFAGSQSFVSMFINEARIVTGLSHGNIAQVFDFGELDGEYFLAMELVHGFPLSKVMKKARAAGLPVLPVPFACFIGAELCKGLHYAHTRRDERGQPLGIIHRDVSPQNVLLSFEGQVKIVDFGIAKAKHASNTETQPGAVKGKYFYFAPEQCRGEPLDARTDVYAAGVVLYEMVTGRLPFEGRMVEVFRRIIAGDFDRPRTVNANIPPALEAIALKAMAADRNARYESAQALGDALGRFLYSQAPQFSTGSLAHLMGMLYREELQREGHAPVLPPEFLRDVEGWRGTPPSGDSAETLADRSRVGAGPARKEGDGTVRLPRAAPGEVLPALRRTPSRPVAALRSSSEQDEDEITVPPDAPTELAPRVHPTVPETPHALGKPGPPVPTPPTVTLPRVEGRPAVELSAELLADSQEVTPIVGGRPRTPTPLAALLGPAVSAPPLPEPREAIEPPTEAFKPRVAAVDANEADEPGTVPLPRVMTPGHLAAPPPAYVPQPSALPKWIFVVIPVLTMLVAGLAVMLVSAREPRLSLSSQPSDAVVFVDGQPAPRRTPLVISDLEAGVPHLLEVHVAGHAPWQHQVTLEPGERRSLHAVLPAPPQQAPAPVTTTPSPP